MTVIAWDGTTLAADRRAVLYGHTVATAKMKRVGDSLVAWSGTQCQAGKYIAWLEAGRDPATYPEQVKEAEAYLVVISPGGIIERFESTGYPLVVDQQTFACGSGRDFALAALHLGCDARRAIEVACALSNECGNGIDTLTFDG